MMRATEMRQSIAAAMAQENQTQFTANVLRQGASMRGIALTSRQIAEAVAFCVANALQGPAISRLYQSDAGNRGFTASQYAGPDLGTCQRGRDRGHAARRNGDLPRQMN